MTPIRAIFVFLLLAASLATAFCAERARVVVGTREVKLSPSAIVSDGVVYAPLSVLKPLGARFTKSKSAVRIIVDGSDLGTIPLSTHDGTEMVRLDEVADLLGAQAEWDDDSSTMTLYSKLVSVGFEGNIIAARLTLPVAATSVRMLQNPLRISFDLPGSKVATDAKSYDVGNANVCRIRVGQFKPDTSRVVVDLNARVAYRMLTTGPDRLIRLQTGPETTLRPVPSKALKGLTVVLDPGHGGIDPGASGGDAKEKDIDLLIALRVKAALTAAGAKVVMTRDADYLIELGSRPSVAERTGADVFISIHCNHSGADGDSNDASGIESYYPDHPDCAELAADVQQALIDSTGATDRHCRPSGGLTVLEESTTPAVLIECGFIDNESERKLLCDEAYRTKIAHGIVVGLETFARRR